MRGILLKQPLEPFTCVLTAASPLSSRGQQGPPLALIAVLLVCLAVLIGAVWGAVSPYKAMSVHARITRAMTSLAYGPHWQEMAGPIPGWRHVEYLQTAPDDPFAYPMRTAWMRAIFILMAAVAALLISCLAFSLLAGSAP